jgi:D-alanyl-D-alanine carboxypeptidase
MAEVHLKQLALAALCAVAIIVPAPVFAQNGRSLALSAEAVLLLDPGGRVLYAKNPDFEHAPASLVKLMTLYLAYEDLEAGRVALDDLAPITRNAVTTPRYRMGLRLGEKVAVRTLMEGVAIASANDAATALAEHLAGDEDTFVARMNAKARDFALSPMTRFANPHGLPDWRQRTNARDMAEITARLLQDHPESRTMLGGQTFLYNGRLYARHIPLFNDPGGVQALKTGFTNEAGYNLAIAAWRAGHRYLLIVMGAQTRSQSFRDARRLLRFGFNEAALDAAEPRREEPRKAPPRRLPPRRSSANVRGGR